MNEEMVLVTGGSGFIGAHCVLQLLNNGYTVRTTVRSLAREAEVRTMLNAGGVKDQGSLSFVEADLTKDDGWAEAVDGCDYVLHVASPFQLEPPEKEDDLIVPAREGTLRVLRKAEAAGVRRVVLTSSYAAIGSGHGPREKPFDETDWSDVDSGDIRAYAKSKTLAERAAWDFIEHHNGSLELTVINPVGVYGPVLGPDLSASVGVIHRLMTGNLPGLPKMSWGIVDVRDVADLHIRAMTHPQTKGERFLAVAGDFISTQELLQIFRRNADQIGVNVRAMALPDWFVRLYALFDKSAAAALSSLGNPQNATNAKARRVLGWTPRSAEDTLIATAESLLQIGLVDP